ncbi:MAG: peptidoglycan-binding protein [Pseudomonadota bacterium]
MKFSTTALLMVTTLGVAPAVADDIALIIANSDYEHTIDLADGDALLGTADAFNAAGFETITLRNASKSDLQNVFRELNGVADQIDRLAVLYSGHTVHTGADTYLTPVDLEDPTGRSISSNAVSVDRLMALLQDYSGAAVLGLGTGQSSGGFFSGGDMGFDDADGLDQGTGIVDIPQGVTLIEGNPTDIASAISDHFLNGESFAQAADASVDVRVSGFVSALYGLNSRAVSPENALENAYWTIASDANTEASYKTYLDRYPNGEYGAEALARIKTIQDGKPKYSREEQAERDLNLTREERRDVQRNLTVLGHDPKGIDGLIGPASRAAISSWQRANFFDVTGFLDANQIQALRSQGEKRSAELAAETERKAEQERQRDLAFWSQTGRSGLEPDLRVYLKEFPDGIYAEEATARLDQIEANKLAQISAKERADWQQVEELDSIEGYQAYLSAYPNGSFKDAASDRIAALQKKEQNAQRIAAARATEKKLGLNASLWKVVETQLAKKDYDPGPVDGKVDKKTRKAIRQYQRNSELPVTGFLDRETLSRLIIFFKL